MRRLLIFFVLLTLSAALPAAAVLPDREEPVRTVFLIRHGEYEHDSECDEDVGCGLVALGRQQARIVAVQQEMVPANSETGSQGPNGMGISFDQFQGSQSCCSFFILVDEAGGIESICTKCP